MSVTRGKRNRQYWVALVVSGWLVLAQTTPLLAATLQQLEITVRDSGLVGQAFQLTRKAQNLKVETGQIYPNNSEFKLALLQLASLLESADTKLKLVTLRGSILDNPSPVEGSIVPTRATQLQQSGATDMLDTVSIKTLAGKRPNPKPVKQATAVPNQSIPVIGDPISDEPPQRLASEGPRAAAGIPVIGEPLEAGQRVADPAIGKGEDTTTASTPFNTGVSVLRAGAPIPVLLAQDVSVPGNRTVPVNATVLQDVFSEGGDLVIPGGSRVSGQIEPAPGGARLVLREIYINDRQYTIRAQSDVYRARVSGGGGSSIGGLTGGLLGGVGGSLFGRSVDRNTGGLWGGLLGGLLGSFIGSSMGNSQRSEVVIPAGPANSRLLEDVTVNNY